ncbi:RAMP superfamily CRISPR-associated protein [Thermoanaerobacterium saccharolyticum]|uniref:RAMP superfamily CRISPR-associated protein n=1 Tax=Thermoanaerobacterium saccharolyticum TaxID=28896 RepID=UPI002FD9F8B9
MAKFETILDGIKDLDNYFYFMKYAYKYKSEKGIAEKYNKDNEEDITRMLKEKFPFFEKRIHQKIKTRISYSKYPLEYFKKSKEIDAENKDNFEFYTVKQETFNDIKFISGILDLDKSKMKSYIDSLVPGSFVIYQEFKLVSPYFSRDDDELYIIDNPILKEKVFKVPMIKGSSWKGLLLHTAFKNLEDKLENRDIGVEDIINIYRKIYRIFGTGSENFRSLKDSLDNYIDKNSKEELIKYALFECGVNINIKKENKSSFIDQIIEQIEMKIENDTKLDVCAIHKGRLVCYPTYFDNLSLEIINPHNRKTKAGDGPIHFEVVPKNAKGYLQLIYIPFDAVFCSDEEIKNQSKEDFEFIKELINKTLTDYGVGAKTKLGWGLAELEKFKCFSNMEGVCENGNS